MPPARVSIPTWEAPLQLFWSSSATVHFGVALGSPMNPAGSPTWTSFMLPSGPANAPNESVRNGKLNVVVDANGCEPAWVAIVPSAFTVEPSKLTTWKSARARDGMSAINSMHVAAASPASSA